MICWYVTCVSPVLDFYHSERLDVWGYLCGWRPPCSPRRAAFEQAGRSDTPQLHARRCPLCDCPTWLRLPQGAQRGQMLPKCVKCQTNADGSCMMYFYTLQISPWRVLSNKIFKKSHYLWLLPFGFALLWRLHLLVVTFYKKRRQHVELLHPHRSRPFLGLLICYLRPCAPNGFKCAHITNFFV